MGKQFGFSPTRRKPRPLTRELESLPNLENVFPSEAIEGSDPAGRNLLFGSDGLVAASYGERLGAPVGVATGSAFFWEADFPTVKYLRIFSRRFGPMPRIARKSSTLLNRPYDLRICKIFSAVTGPIPGTCCSSSDVAVLMLMGASGGFFFAAAPATTQRNTFNQRQTRQDLRAIRKIIHEGIY
jgi:hypothetical protein